MDRPVASGQWEGWLQSAPSARWMAVAAAVTLALVFAGPAPAQNQVEVRTAPRPAFLLRFAPPSPATREATKPSEAGFYREDVRVRHEPVFVEPFVSTTKGGNVIGLSGWTSPAAPVGSLASQGHQQSNGWLSFGITVVFDYPSRAGAGRGAVAVRQQD